MWTPTFPDHDGAPCGHCASAQPGAPCAACGCKRATLYDLANGELLVPDVSMADFNNILATKGARASVATRELAQFEAWTKEFGSEGA